MRIKTWLEFAGLGLQTVLFRRHQPLIGSIIITDRCNLSCCHCAVSNITCRDYPYAQIRADMASMYAAGVRVLLFYGGEPLLWQAGSRTVRDLVLEAKGMGFLLVSVVTNGTFPLELPEADLLLVSLDGGREKHNRIRGETYAQILANLEAASADNICLYMAINRINIGEIETVCALARDLKHVRAVSFNFHTPYPGTEHLRLSREEKESCCARLERLMGQGFPVLNLKSAFSAISRNSFPTPCRQCMLMENGRQWTCGRCSEIDGLCRECGFFFAAEYALLFRGNPRVVWEMVKTYRKYF